MIVRVPEPELMDDPAQAAAYAAADFSGPHQAFVERFRAAFPAHHPKRVIDLGCGTADVTIRFARAYRESTVVGVDASPAMLAVGHEAVSRAGLVGRIRLDVGYLTRDGARSFGTGQDFDTVISNSLLHHLADPKTLWGAINRLAAKSVVVFVMDLRRPASLGAVDTLVAEHATDEAELFRRDFRSSLRAAYTAEEVREQLEQSGLQGLCVEAIGDRHLIVWGAASAA